MEIIEQSNINSDIGIYPHLFIFLGFIFAHLLLLLLSVPYVLTRPSLCNAVKAGSQHCSRKSENNLDLIFFAFRGICIMFYNNNILLTAVGLSPGGSSYFTCKPNMKSVTTKFNSGGLHEKHVVATWNLGNHLSICFWAQGNQEKPVSRWPVAGPSEY